MTKRLMGEEQVNEIFREMTPIDGDMVRFMERDVLPSYLIYDRKKGTAYCTHCEKTFDVKDIMDGLKAHHDHIECPKCGHKCAPKCEGRFKRSIYDFGYAVMLSRHGDKVVERIFDVWRHVDAHERTQRCNRDEVTRVVYDGSKEFDIYDKLRGHWVKCQNRNWEGYIATHVKFFDCHPYNLYTANIKEVLDGTFYEHCCLKEFAEDVVGGRIGLFGAGWYLHKYDTSCLYEYLFKTGLHRLASELWRGHSYGSSPDISRDAKTLQEMLYISKPQLKELIRRKDSADKMMLTYIQNGIDFGEYDTYRRIIGDEWPCIKRLKGKYKFSADKLERYLCGDADEKRTLRDYLDYLEMADKVGWDLKSQFVAFPKDLKERHDMAVEIHNDMLAKEEEKKLASLSESYAKLLKKCHKAFDFGKENLSIVVPENCGMIAAEGISLHHCVGTYVQRVSKGETVILFVRQTNAIDKPYYTMEVCNKRLIQCRGMKNCAMTDEVKAFVREFCKQKRIKNDVA